MHARQPAFSLVEVVVVIGLLSLVTGLVVANVENLIPAFESTPVEVKFRQAVREARIQAATDNRPVYLRYNPSSEDFDIIEQSAQPDEEEPLFTDSPYYRPELEVEFLPVPADDYGGLNRFGGIDAAEPVPYLTFHPSGVSTPAHIRFRWRNGDEATLTLDPFSSGPLADKELFQ